MNYINIVVFCKLLWQFWRVYTVRVRVIVATPTVDWVGYSPLLLSVVNVNYHQLYVFTVNDITYLPINIFNKFICLFPYFPSLGSRFSGEQTACAIRCSFNSLGALRILNLQTAHACILVRIAPFQSSLPVALPINILIVMRPLNLHKSHDSARLNPA